MGVLGGDLEGRGSPCVREAETEKAKESDGAAGNSDPLGCRLTLICPK